MSKSGHAQRICFLQRLKRFLRAFFHLFSPSTKGGGTLQQHLTLLGRTGDLSSAVGGVAAESPAAAAFQGCNKRLSIIPRSNQRRVERSQRQLLRPAL